MDSDMDDFNSVASSNDFDNDDAGSSLGGGELSASWVAWGKVGREA